MAKRLTFSALRPRNCAIPVYEACASEGMERCLGRLYDPKGKGRPHVPTRQLQACLSSTGTVFRVLAPGLAAGARADGGAFVLSLSPLPEPDIRRCVSLWLAITCPREDGRPLMPGTLDAARDMAMGDGLVFPAEPRPVAVTADAGEIDPLAWDAFSMYATRRLAGSVVYASDMAYHLAQAGQSGGSAELMTMPSPVQYEADDGLQEAPLSLTLTLALQSAPGGETLLNMFPGTRTFRTRRDSGDRRPYLEGRAHAKVGVPGPDGHIDRYWDVPVGYVKEGDTYEWDELSEQCYSAFNLDAPLPAACEEVRSPQDWLPAVPGRVQVCLPSRMKGPWNGFDPAVVQPGVLPSDMDALARHAAEALADVADPMPSAPCMRRRRYADACYSHGERARTADGETTWQTKPTLNADAGRLSARLGQGLRGETLALETYPLERDTSGLDAPTVRWPDVAAELLQRLFGDGTRPEVSQTPGRADPWTRPLYERGTKKPKPKALRSLALARTREVEAGLRRTDRPTFAIVEIPDHRTYEDGADPKQAIAHGLARSGRIPQFINPMRASPSQALSAEVARLNRRDGDSEYEWVAPGAPDGERTGGGKVTRVIPSSVVESALAATATADRPPKAVRGDVNRIEGAVRDGLSVFMLPDPTRADKGDVARPHVTVGVRAVNVRPDGRRMVAIPLATVVDWEAGTIDAASPSVDGGTVMPLWRLLVQLARLGTPAATDAAGFQTWLRDLLDDLSSPGRPVVLEAESKNPLRTRRLWPGLSNGGIASKGRVTLLGEGLPPSVSLVRVRVGGTSGAPEVPTLLPRRKLPGERGSASQWSSESGIAMPFPHVYWSVADRPNDKNYKDFHRYGDGKASHPTTETKRRCVVEYYVEAGPLTDEEAVWEAEGERAGSVQWGERVTNLPLPLHLLHHVCECVSPAETADDDG